MRSKIIVVFFLTTFILHNLSLAISVSATEWEMTFGGKGGDTGQSIQRTVDSGYIITGASSSFSKGNSDVYLIKIDGHGVKKWENTFGGTNNDIGWSVQQTLDGGYIIVGLTKYTLSTDMYLVKTDANGIKTWDKTIGGAGYESGMSVKQTDDNGYIIAGYKSKYTFTDKDVYLVKVDNSGNIIWEKTYGGTDADNAFSVAQTSDGGYIITGETKSFGNGDADVYVIKTDGSGTIIWEKTYGGTGSDGGSSVAQTLDGGYIITGVTKSFGEGGSDVYLVKIDASGNKIWDNSFGGPRNDMGWSVQQTMDGGYIIAGNTNSFGEGDNDVYLIKTDLAGTKSWDKTFGCRNADYGFSVQEASDGGYIIAGVTESFGEGASDVYLIKTFRDSVDYYSMLDHFVINNGFFGIGNQYVNKSFEIDIAAKNICGRTLKDWNGEVFLWSNAGENSVSPASVLLGNGQWSGDISINTAGSDIHIQTNNGKSNDFTVTGEGDGYGSISGEIKNNAGGIISGEVKVYMNGQLQVETATGAYQKVDIACGSYEIYARHTATGNESQKYYRNLPCDKPVTLDIEIPFCTQDSLTPVVLVPGVMGTTGVTSKGPYPVLPKGSPAWDSGDLELHLPRITGWHQLLKALEKAGYQKGCNLFGAPYDWRVDIDDIWVKYLKPRIGQAKTKSGQDKVNIVAHSMGGLVTRAYIQSSSYENDIDRFAMVGTPNEGSSTTYYMWEGGDPKLLDDVVTTGSMWENFYWNTTEKNYEKLHSGSIWHWQHIKIWNYYTGGNYDGTNSNNNMITIKRLLPTYPFLRHNNDNNQVEPLQIVTNDFLTILNSDAHRFNMGKGDGKVQTAVFVGTGKDTIKWLDVTNTYGINLYRDGNLDYPFYNKKDSVAAYGDGDGTVLETSASLPFTEGWAYKITDPSGSETRCDDHKSLIKCFASDIVSFIAQSGSAASALSSAPALSAYNAAAAATVATDRVLSISITGRVLPYLVNPSDLKSGINYVTDQRENNIPETTITLLSDTGALTVDNPEDGIYTLYLKGINNEDFGISFSYMDSASGEEDSYSGFNHSNTISFTFTVDSTLPDKITVNYTPLPPTGLQADAVDSGGLMTQLAWDASASDPDVTGYNIYSKEIDEPYLQQVGTSATNSFDTGHPWAANSTIKTRMYAVAAVYSDGTESFLSGMMENNDRDHDGVSDQEEINYGTYISNPDTDGDGLNDAEEYNRGTNPRLSDTDGDDYSDYDEVLAGSDPLDEKSVPAVDSDGDRIFDDGDNSGTNGDNPCTGGNTVACDDNCPDDYNPDQADKDKDGIGDVCDSLHYSQYDTNQDWSIGDYELLDAIDQWANGNLGDFELLDLIDFWAVGCYHWDLAEQAYKQGC